MVLSVLNCNYIFWVNVVLPHWGKFGKEEDKKKKKCQLYSLHPDNPFSFIFCVSLGGLNKLIHVKHLKLEHNEQFISISMLSQLWIFWYIFSPKMLKHVLKGDSHKISYHAWLRPFLIISCQIICYLFRQMSHWDDFNYWEFLPHVESGWVSYWIPCND